MLILYTEAYLLEWEESLRTLNSYQEILLKILLKILFILYILAQHSYKRVLWN